MRNTMNNGLIYVEAMLVRTLENKALAVILFKKMFFEFPQQMIVIKKAIAQKEMVIALKELHKLKGGLIFCGFYALAKFTKNLENFLLINNVEKIDAALFLLTEEIEQFISLRDIILKQLLTSKKHK